MADRTSDGYLKVLGEAVFEKWALDSSAAQTVYVGQPMIIDQSEDTVNVRAYVNATTVASTDVFVGIAAEPTTVASGASELTSKIQLWVGPTILGFPSTAHSYTNADNGKTIYMSDSGTLSSTASQNPQIGKLHRVEDGYAYVELVTPQICSGA